MTFCFYESVREISFNLEKLIFSVLIFIKTLIKNRPLIKNLSKISVDEMRRLVLNVYDTKISAEKIQNVPFWLF